MKHSILALSHSAFPPGVELLEAPCTRSGGQWSAILVFGLLARWTLLGGKLTLFDPLC